MSTMVELRRSAGHPFAALAVVCALLMGPTPALAQDATAAAESSPEERAKVRVFEALDLMDAGSYGEARLMLNLALGLNADLDRAWYYLAQCNVELRDWPEALKALARYEAADLSEHERMQIANLRASIQEQQAFDGGGEDAEQADSGGASQSAPATAAPSQAAAAPAAEATGASQAGAAATAARAPGGVPPALGPAMMIVGAIVGGIGGTIATVAFAQANEHVDALDQSSLDAGKPPYDAGLATAIGGGVVFAVGIPLSIAGKKKARVAISYHGDAVQPGAAVYLMGRW